MDEQLSILISQCERFALTNAAHCIKDLHFELTRLRSAIKSKKSLNEDFRGSVGDVVVRTSKVLTLFEKKCSRKRNLDVVDIRDVLSRTNAVKTLTLRIVHQLPPDLSIVACAPPALPPRSSDPATAFWDKFGTSQSAIDWDVWLQSYQQHLGKELNSSSQSMLRGYIGITLSILRH